MGKRRPDAGLPIEQIRKDWTSPGASKLLFEGLSGPQVIFPNENDGAEGVIGKTISIIADDQSRPIITLQVEFDTNDQTLYLNNMLIDRHIADEGHDMAVGTLKRIVNNTINYAQHQLLAERLVLGGRNQTRDNQVHGAASLVASRAYLKPTDSVQDDRAREQVMYWIERYAHPNVTLASIDDVQDGVVKVRYSDTYAATHAMGTEIGTEIREWKGADIANHILHGEIIPVDRNVELMPISSNVKNSSRLKQDAIALQELAMYENDKQPWTGELAMQTVRSSCIGQEILSHVDAEMSLDLTDKRAVDSAQSYLKGGKAQQEAVTRAIKHAQGVSMS
ncbi:MAG: hypothetical protein MRY32_04525 [Rickettsiales bacterium]|nr:hypothetical protein [Rickettsiales bacterium]